MDMGVEVNVWTVVRLERSIRFFLPKKQQQCFIVVEIEKRCV